MANRTLRLQIRTSHPALQKLFDAMEASDMTVTHLAKRSGVSANSIVDWKKMHDARLSNLDACLKVVGLKIVVEPIEPLAASNDC